MQAGHPTPWSAPPPAAGQVRPSTWWFGAAGAVAAVGLIVATVIVVRGFVGWFDRIDHFDRADLPATLEVEITETGGYSIYHETTFLLADDPDVEVTSPSGDTVPLDRYDGSVTYATGDYEGEGLYTFEATETGVYEVEASGGGVDSSIAVGRGVGDSLVGPIITGVLVGFLSVVAGVVIAIVVGVSRSRNRRALTPAPAMAGWGAPGWGRPPGPPPGPYGAAGGYPPGYPPPPTPAAPLPPPARPPQQVSSPHDGAGAPSPSGPPPPSPSVPPRDGAVPSSPGVSPRDGAVPSSPGVSPSPPAPAPAPPGAPAGGGHAMGGPAEVRGAFGPRSTASSSAAGLAGQIIDPPSLRAPLDWSRGDLPLHWSPPR